MTEITIQVETTRKYTKEVRELGYGWENKEFKILKEYELSDAIILKSLDAPLKETFSIVWNATKSGITYDIIKCIVAIPLWEIAKKGYAKIKVSGRNLKEFDEEEFSRIIREEIQKDLDWDASFYS